MQYLYKGDIPWIKTDDIKIIQHSHSVDSVLCPISIDACMLTLGIFAGSLQAERQPTAMHVMTGAP